MKQIIPFIILVTLLVSCHKSDSIEQALDMSANNRAGLEKEQVHKAESGVQTLSQVLNDTTEQPDSQAFANCPSMGTGRTLVYLLNPKEVSSVACYAMLIFNLDFGQCRYDSLITVVQSADMCAIESQLEKAHVASPACERKLYDSAGRITRNLEASAQWCNLFLFENRKLIFSCRVQDYLPTGQAYNGK